MGAGITESRSSSPKASYPSLEGRNVFITGGASGIGATVVEEFHAQKASVAFQMGVQVRNRLVTAYKDIMNMQV